jgi:hypothetical protein
MSSTSNGVVALKSSCFFSSAIISSLFMLLTAAFEYLRLMRMFLRPVYMNIRATCSPSNVVPRALPKIRTHSTVPVDRETRKRRCTNSNLRWLDSWLAVLVGFAGVRVGHHESLYFSLPCCVSEHEMVRLGGTLVHCAGSTCQEKHQR